MKKKKISSRRHPVSAHVLKKELNGPVIAGGVILSIIIFTLLIAGPPLVRSIIERIQAIQTNTAVSSIKREATAQGSAQPKSATVQSGTVPSGSGFLYLAAVSTKPNIRVSSVDGLGLTWNLAARQCSGRSNAGTEVWWGYGTPSASGTVHARFTDSANLDSAVIAVTVYSGAGSPIVNPTGRNSIGLNDTTCAGGATQSSYSLPITADMPGSLVYSAVSIRTRRHIALNEFTEIAEVHSDTNNSDMSGIATMERIVTAAGTVNADGKLNSNVDYAVVGFSMRPVSVSLSPTPTPPAGGTPQPTRTPTPATPASPTSTPAPVPSAGYIWVSPAELAAVPIAGQEGCDSFCSSAWNAVVHTANSTWHAPNLSEYVGVDHSREIWAGAVTAVRLSFVPGKESEAQKYKTKTIAGLEAVMGTEQAALPENNGGIDDGRLAIARQFLRYVTAADLLGIDNWGAGYKGYRNYVDYMLKTKFVDVPGDGGKTLSEMHKCASNGCAMGGGSRIASAAYLGDLAELTDAWNTFRRYTGDLSSPVSIYFSTTGQNWYHDNSAKSAINPKGATCAGTSYPADGVIPNDQGRGGLCPSDAMSTPGYTQYPWEGLQGAYAQAVMLHRLGYKDVSGRNPWQINDAALKRAVEYQWYLQSRFGGSWFDSSRAAWVKHLAYRIYGIKPLQYNASDGGRNMSLTQWTHLNYSQ